MPDVGHKIGVCRAIMLDVRHKIGFCGTIRWYGFHVLHSLPLTMKHRGTIMPDVRHKNGELGTILQGFFDKNGHF